MTTLLVPSTFWFQCVTAILEIIYIPDKRVKNFYISTRGNQIRTMSTYESVADEKCQKREIPKTKFKTRNP